MTSVGPGIGDERELVVLQAGAPVAHAVDPQLEPLLERERALAGIRPIGIATEDWEPFDLRIARPRAVDLRKLWGLTGQSIPATISAALGPRVPILMHHRLTPFPKDGHPPGGVWALGYEFAPLSLSADTVAVLPSDEFLKVMHFSQQADIGIDLSGAAQVGTDSIPASGNVVDLGGASIRATTRQSFQFNLTMDITLRKVIGAAVGSGGALWKMYRQDEALDRPHTLLHTLLIPEGTRRFQCVVRTWAVRAGILGTRLRSRYWPYEDQTFAIELHGLGA